MYSSKLRQLARCAVVPVLATGLSMAALAQTQNPPGPSPGGGSAQPPQAQAGPSKRVNLRELRASKLIGMSVRDAQGKNIGQIEDLVVNMNNGDVRYAVLSFDPGILSPEQLFAVPTKELRLGASGNDVVYRVQREQLERAAIPKADWNDRFFGDARRIATLDKAWNIQSPAPGQTARRASDLLGKEVSSRSGEEIGELEELVVSMNQQKVHYAVLNFDPSWAGEEKRVVFPLSSFEVTPARNNELTLDVDKSKIRSLKDFTTNRYDNLEDQAWLVDVDRYLIAIVPPAQDTRASGAGSAGGNSGETKAKPPSTGSSPAPAQDKR